MIAIPFVMAAAVLLFLPYAKFAPLLPPAEKGPAVFTPIPVPAIAKRQPVTAVGLESPVRIPVRIPVELKKVFPTEPLSRIAPPPVPYVLTLVLVNNGRKMAIINGIVVKEGDMINTAVVRTIETNGVLLRDKKESRWLKVE